jgi:hypothetical protein
MMRAPGSLYLVIDETVVVSGMVPPVETLKELLGEYRSAQ